MASERQEAEEHVRLRVDPVRVRRSLVGLVVLLTALHFVAVVPDLPHSRVVNLDAEASLGTWLSSTMFTVAAVLAFVLAAPFERTRRCVSFAGFGAALLLCGIEEIWALHEPASLRLGEATDRGDSYASGTPLMGLALLPVAAAGFVQLWRSTVSKPMPLLVGSVVWYVATFGVEQIEAWSSAGSLRWLGSEDVVRSSLNGVQEGGEMLGIAVLISGLLVELAALGRSLVLSAGPR